MVKLKFNFEIHRDHHETWHVYRTPFAPNFDDSKFSCSENKPLRATMRLEQCFAQWTTNNGSKGVRVACQVTIAVS